MKTYWDHTEQERAEMDERRVSDLLDIELMEKGVLKVIAPVLEDVTPVALPKVRVYAIRHKLQYSHEKLDVVFDSIEAAEDFLALNPSVRVENYGTEAHFKPLREASISPEDLPGEQAVIGKQAALSEFMAREQRNERARSEYSAALAKVDAATESIWSDWRQCLSRRDRMQKIAATRAEYMRLTGGDANVAEAFLAKAFRADEVAEEAEWSGLKGARAALAENT